MRINFSSRGFLKKRVDEPDVRALYTTLEAISLSRELFDTYLLKGGLALNLIYGSPRRSMDLDINAVESHANMVTGETDNQLLAFCERLNNELRRVCTANGFARLYTSNEELSRESPILRAGVAYETDHGVSGDVKMQVTLSETICAEALRDINGLPLRVAALEDILAEKLKALLQQVTRSTVRPMDVYDIWYFTTVSRLEVDPGTLTQFLLEKCKAWPIPPLTKSQFRREDVIGNSGASFEELRQDVMGADFVPFEEAYAGVLALVDRMDLPA